MIRTITLTLTITNINLNVDVDVNNYVFQYNDGRSKESKEL